MSFHLTFFLFVGFFFLNWSIVDFSVALVSDIQQSDSAIYINIHTHTFFFRFFFIISNNYAFDSDKLHHYVKKEIHLLHQKDLFLRDKIVGKSVNLMEDCGDL